MEQPTLLEYLEDIEDKLFHNSCEVTVKTRENTNIYCFIADILEIESGKLYIQDSTVTNIIKLDLKECYLHIENDEGYEYYIKNHNNKRFLLKLIVTDTKNHRSS